jgi:hypothetical protein
MSAIVGTRDHFKVFRNLAPTGMIKENFGLGLLLGDCTNGHLAGHFVCMNDWDVHAWEGS